MSDPFDPGALADLLAATGDDPDVVARARGRASSPMRHASWTRCVRAVEADERRRRWCGRRPCSRARHSAWAPSAWPSCAARSRTLARRGATLEAAARLDDARDRVSGGRGCAWKRHVRTGGTPVTARCAVGRHRPADGRLPRHRVGRAAARRGSPVRAAVPGGRAGRALLVDGAQPPRRLPGGLRRVRRGAHRRATTTIARRRC